MTIDEEKLLYAYGFRRKKIFEGSVCIGNAMQKSVESKMIHKGRLVFIRGKIHLQGIDKLTKKRYTINTFDINVNNLIQLS